MKSQTLLPGIFIAFCSLLSPYISVADTLYKEASVSLDTGIEGIICQPEAASPIPAVLMLHGFASSKNEVGNLYQRLAKRLCEKGIASLRIDFRGNGNSTVLSMEQSSIETMLEDAETAYQYLNTQQWIDSSRMGIVGFSLGGGITIVTAAQHPARYKALVTWSSVGDFHQDFLSLRGQDNFDHAAKHGRVDIDLGWRKVSLGHGFFTALDNYKLSDEIKKYSGSYLAIAGSEDFSSFYTNAYVASAAGKHKQGIIIEGADHIFGVLEEDQTTAEQVINTTLEWFLDSL